MAIKNFTKDPLEVLDYVLNFGPTATGVVPADPGWLTGGDLLTGSPAVTITGADAVLVLGTPAPAVSNGGLGVTLWLAAGTPAVTYNVKVSCGTVQGRTVARSLNVTVDPE